MLQSAQGKFRYHPNQGILPVHPFLFLVQNIAACGGQTMTRDNSAQYHIISYLNLQAVWWGKLTNFSKTGEVRARRPPLSQFLFVLQPQSLRSGESDGRRDCRCDQGNPAPRRART